MNANEFQFGVVHSLADLASLAGMDKRRLRRLLESGGIKLHKVGGKMVVCRVDLREALPGVYEALLQRAQVLETS